MDTSDAGYFCILLAFLVVAFIFPFGLISIIKDKDAKIKRLESGKDTDLIKLTNIIIETSKNVPEKDAFKIAKKIIDLGWQPPSFNSRRF
jgi:hypothetical protein